MSHVSMESINGVKNGNLNPSIAIEKFFEDLMGQALAEYFKFSEMLHLLKICPVIMMICSAPVAPSLA